MHRMATGKSRNASFGFTKHSESDDSADLSDSSSDRGYGCSHFYRQTAKVRFTRTTSKVHQRLETKAADADGYQLLGCLRRVSSSTSQTSQYLEKSGTNKVSYSGLCDLFNRHFRYALSRHDKLTVYMHSQEIPTIPRVNRDAERKRKELEEVRRRVNKMDDLFTQTQRTDAEQVAFSAPCATSTPCSPRKCAPVGRSLADVWITRLATASEVSGDECLSSSPPDEGRSCCWDWCASAPSSWPPHVEIEPFNGDPKDWPTFIANFKRRIHDAMPNDTLRMIYLEELLAPELKEKHAAFLRYPASYCKLLAHLRNHYGHPLLVTRSCFAALRQLSSIDPRNVKGSIAEFTSQVQRIVDSIRMVGCEEELRTFSALELSGLVRKLTDDLRNKWDLHTGDKCNIKPLPTLSEFIVWLEERAMEATWYT